MNILSLSSESKRVLNALANPRHAQGRRTVAGIVQETGLTAEQVATALEDNRAVIRHDWSSDWYQLNPAFAGQAHLRKALMLNSIINPVEDAPLLPIVIGSIPPSVAASEATEGEDSETEERTVTIVLSANDKKVLYSLGNPRFERGRRSVAGLAAETGLAEAEVTNILSNRLRPIVTSDFSRGRFSVNNSVSGMDTLRELLILDGVVFGGRLNLVIGGRVTPTPAGLEVADNFNDDDVAGDDNDD